MPLNKQPRYLSVVRRRSIASILLPFFCASLPTTTMGWMQHYSTTIPATNYNSRLLSTSETIMRTNNNSNNNDLSRMRTRTPLSISPSRLFSSMSTTTDDNYRKEVSPAQQQILGVTLAGDYLIQMRVKSPSSSSSSSSGSSTVSYTHLTLPTN